MYLSTTLQRGHTNLTQHFNFLFVLNFYNCSLLWSTPVLDDKFVCQLYIIKAPQEKTYYVFFMQKTNCIDDTLAVLFLFFVKYIIRIMLEKICFLVLSFSIWYHIWILQESSLPRKGLNRPVTMHFQCNVTSNCCMGIVVGVKNYGRIHQPLGVSHCPRFTKLLLLRVVLRNCGVVFFVTKNQNRELI